MNDTDTKVHLNLYLYSENLPFTLLAASAIHRYNKMRAWLRQNDIKYSMIFYDHWRRGAPDELEMDSESAIMFRLRFGL